MELQRCDCCGGRLPSRPVWEYLRNISGKCDGTVNDAGNCRAFLASDWELQDMADVLDRYGARFTGGDVAEVAQDWLDHDFEPDTVGEWLDAGFWDAATAAEVRDAGVSAEAARKTAQRLSEADDASETYTDGDPIYSACNGDTNVAVLIS